MSDIIPDPVIRTTRSGAIDPELVALFHAAATSRGLDALTSPTTHAADVTYERADGDVSLTFDWDQGLEVYVGINAMGLGSDLHHLYDWTAFWDRVDASMRARFITADDLRTTR